MRRLNRKLVVLSACLSFFMSSCISKHEKQEESAGKRCPLCETMGGTIVQFPRDFQGGKIIYQDGEEEWYCGMVHLMMGWELAQAEKNPVNPAIKRQVLDYDSQEFVDVEKVFYVFGSDIPTKIYAQSVISFKTRAGAENFSKIHQGEVCDFKELKKKELIVVKKLAGGRKKWRKKQTKKFKEFKRLTETWEKK